LIPRSSTSRKESRTCFLWAILTSAARLPAAAAAILALTSPAPAEPLAVREVAPGVDGHQGEHGEATLDNHGGIANIGFIVGGKAVAVIDSGGSARQGRQLREAIRGVTDLPIRFVINTHVHPDHVFGNAAFLDDRPAFVGHAKLPRAMAARAGHYLKGLHERLGPLAEGTKAVPPGLLVDDRMNLDLGGRVLHLTAHRTAHTDNDLSIHDAATGTLFAGDLLFMERVPVVDGSIKGWLNEMAELRAIEVHGVVPGHGPTLAAWPEALEAQERYLRLLLEEVRAVIRDGGTIDQALAGVGSSERKAWLLFDDYNPRNVVTAFTELEWE
jgi:quinoprotein relay system zinc metallohydrolase 2